MSVPPKVPGFCGVQPPKMDHTVHGNVKATPTGFSRELPPPGLSHRAGVRGPHFLMCFFNVFDLFESVADGLQVLGGIPSFWS